MTTTPQEPTEEPEVAPAGDPSPPSSPDPDNEDLSGPTQEQDVLHP